MGKTLHPDDCWTCGDVDECLEQNGAILVRHEKHIIRRLGPHTFVYPWHKRNQRLSPGVRNQLVKLMKAAGISAIILGLGYLALPYLMHI